MIQQAMKKLQDEMIASPNNGYIQAVGGFLMKQVRNYPDLSENIMTDGKTIAGSLEEMKKEARKNQTNGVGVISDEEGFRIVLKYFGLEVSVPEPIRHAGLDIDVDSLL